MFAISERKWNIEVGFLLANKHQRFLQIDTIILVVARPPQVIQNNKFAISLQYLQKVSCKLILWFWWGWWSSQNTKFPMSLQYLKKRSWFKEIKLIFYMQINIRIPNKLIWTLWASTFSTKWYYHYWWHDSTFSKYSKWQTFNSLTKSQKWS